MTGHALDDAAVLAARGAKVQLDPTRAYAVILEKERMRGGEVEDVLTVFLTNRECPFRCVMCDLWTYTLDQSLEPGQVLAQLDHALEGRDDVRHIKLYNAGNFFDRKAIPFGDRAAIARRLSGFETVIIENHPKLCGREVVEWAGLLSGQLEVAMGLETAHPDVLRHLNKRMTTDDFCRAAERIIEAGIGVRVFVLLQPPFMPTDQAQEWAVRSARLAFESGAGVCTIIPTRAGNGIMDQLADAGRFNPPTLAALEDAQLASLPLAGDAGRLFVDLWDVGQFSTCTGCLDERVARMERINHTQQPEPPVACAACGST